MAPEKEDCSAVRYEALLLGEGGVGKSALLTHLRGRLFTEKTIPTVAKDFVTKLIEIDGATIELRIWDAPSQEQFDSIRRQLYHGTQGVVFVYDITNPDSFNHLEYWIDKVEEVMCHEHSKYEPIPIILCGNKKDLEDQRQVTTEEASELVSEGKVFEFFETSAKTGENVVTVFEKLAFHIADICNPHLMLSYHPNMQKEDTTELKEETTLFDKQKEKKQKKKNDKQKSKKKKEKTKKKKDGVSRRPSFSWSCFSCRVKD